MVLSAKFRLFLRAKKKKKKKGGTELQVVRRGCTNRLSDATECKLLFVFTASLHSRRECDMTDSEENISLACPSEMSQSVCKEHGGAAGEHNSSVLAAAAAAL